MQQFCTAASNDTQQVYERAGDQFSSASVQVKHEPSENLSTSMIFFVLCGLTETRLQHLKQFMFLLGQYSN
jgi:hypothetical protein